MDYKLAMLGFGNVGRALARLLERKRPVLKDEYGITFSVTGIGTGRHGAAINAAGLDFIKAAEWVEAGKSIEPLSKAAISDNFDFIAKCGADVLFENTPVEHLTGRPAVDHVRAALQAGMHVCTANKGTVVHGYSELTDLAASRGRKFLHEATVLGGAPLFSVMREGMPAARVLSFKGILNATTNIILTRMESGESLEDAVRYCQSIGIAETDPSKDVDGWDAAIKVAALATVLMGAALKPQDVSREGIRSLTPEAIARARAEGKRWKLVCTAERDGESVRARVAPELVSVSSPLYGMEGSASVVELITDVLGPLSIVEGESTGLVSGPETTAYGLLADFINAVR